MSDKKIYSVIWAKKKEVDGDLLWLPLDIHLEDTMMISGLLFEHFLCEGQRNYLSNSIGCDIDTVKQLIMFLGRVHDIGKATPAFQIQKSHDNFNDLDMALLKRLEIVGFDGICDLILPSRQYSHHSISGEWILKSYGLKDDLGSVIGGHHGKTSSYELLEKQAAYTSNYYQTENTDSKIANTWKNIRKLCIKKALDKCGFNSLDELPEIPQTCQVILLGLLIMADWLSSNERYFPLIDINELTIDDYEGRIKNAWTLWYKNSPFDYNINFSNAKNHYNKRFLFSPRDFQNKIYDEIHNSKSPGIVIIEAPMGKGKTEAALIAVEQLSRKSGKSGILFGLPTQATSNGIFPRVNLWLKSVAKELGENVSLRLVHGKAALNEEFKNIPNSSNINIDDISYGSVFVNQWFSGRKTACLDDFVVGTVDQFLLIALKQKHLALRHLGITKKVVVIDEVHAYDAYMSEYLFEALEWLGAYNVPVVILSATLPSATRKKLIKYYLKGKGVKERNIKKELEDINSLSYPVLTYTDELIIKQFDNFTKDEQKKIEILRIDEALLYEKIRELYGNNGIIGIIVNTVKRAQEIAGICEELLGADSFFLLHSNFIDSDRAEKEKELMKMIGKSATRPNRKVIIGTQVLEQSLDIDFDVLITDLAPMDLLIQRLGRLHRHDSTIRNDYFKSPKVYVLGTSEELEFDRGSKGIYGGYLLIRTQHFLKDEIILPDDISKLVQSVYSDDEISVREDFKNIYLKEKEKHNTKIERKKLKALTFLINSPKLKVKSEKNNLIEWINVETNYSEERAYAQVRDIDETLEVIVLKSRVENKPSKELAKDTLRLNRSSIGFIGFDEAIKTLEKYNKNELAFFDDDVWLKGKLGIILDDNNEFHYEQIHLKYDDRYGLIKTEGKDEQL